MRPMLRTSIRLIDLLAALLWVSALVMLIVTSVRVTQSAADAEVRLLMVWTLFLGKLSLGATVISVATWIVRQFEDAFRISENVHEINNELAEMRDRRRQQVPHQPRGL